MRTPADLFIVLAQATSLTERTVGATSSECSLQPSLSSGETWEHSGDGGGHSGDTREHSGDTGGQGDSLLNLARAADSHFVG